MLPIQRIGCLSVAMLMFIGLGMSPAGAQQQDQVVSRLRSGDDDQVRKAVDEIRAALQSNPVDAVDHLNQTWMVALLNAKQYAAVEEFATAGTIAACADTWRIEQLQKHRIAALLAENKPQDALHAAKALFNVCGMGFTKDALPLLVDSLKAVHPEDPSIVPKFKLQVLANAQEDPNERKRLLAKHGGNSVMDSIPADPAPYVEAIDKRKGLADYRNLVSVPPTPPSIAAVQSAHSRVHESFQTSHLAKVA